MAESYDNAYECRNKQCWFYKRYKKHYHWYSPESDLKKIKYCPECGETEKIYRRKEEVDETKQNMDVLKYMVG